MKLTTGMRRALTWFISSIDGREIPSIAVGRSQNASFRALLRRGFIDRQNKGRHDGVFVITPRIGPMTSLNNQNNLERLVDSTAAELYAVKADLERLTAEREEAAAEITRLREQVAAKDKALEIARLALNDWLTTYAPDECHRAHVAEAKHRLMDKGTLAYIANALAAVRSAIGGGL